ncbi:hypothetical protein Aeqsu_1201 [Aequorivita sublithincola DSM 14238]|uniref:Uncharacterized protein n=1 Tax=Aequorivita sublithincola (strain DSM 14238 / LMG 21431 / ACAM 643 / 9-3) TaxID=746697 RepID=I3YUM9_AEQSU|nr:hypothetical protein [Aequorivita sublithincola]AFL80697.1 hypothetical protein Aeqsu_1201 [Aequorivita sublithincola DSM 14238]
MIKSLVIFLTILFIPLHFLGQQLKGPIEPCESQPVVFDLNSEYFYEGFDYCNYAEMRQITYNKRWYWVPRHEMDIDINSDGIIEPWEDHRNQEITNIGGRTCLKFESARPKAHSVLLAEFAPALWTEVWDYHSGNIIQELNLNIPIETTSGDLLDFWPTF